MRTPPLTITGADEDGHEVLSWLRSEIRGRNIGQPGEDIYEAVVEAVRARDQLIKILEVVAEGVSDPAFADRVVDILAPRDVETA